MKREMCGSKRKLKTILEDFTAHLHSNDDVTHSSSENYYPSTLL